MFICLTARFRLFIACALIVMPGHSSGALFSVADPVFCSHVDPHDNYRRTNEAQDGKIARSMLKHGKLYLYVVIVGNEATIDHLEQYGYLELEGVIITDGVTRDSAQFGMTPEKWEIDGDSYKSELKKSGFFTFRTYMTTRKINHSVVEIRLRNGKGQVVPLVGGKKNLPRVEILNL